MTNTQTQKISKLMMIAVQVVFVAGFAFMLVSALHPEARSSMRGILAKDFRMIVSTAKGDLACNGTQYTVVKVKTRDTLSLEIYENLENGTTKMLERIDMPDKKDGYFNFNGQAMNLAIADIDSDGRPEIIAPSFDQNLVGHVNIYQYSQDSNGFKRVLR